MICSGKCDYQFIEYGHLAYDCDYWPFDGYIISLKLSDTLWAHTDI